MLVTFPSIPDPKWGVIFLHPPDATQMDEANRTDGAKYIKGDDAPGSSEAWAGLECKEQGISLLV